MKNVFEVFKPLLVGLAFCSVLTTLGLILLYLCFNAPSVFMAIFLGCFSYLIGKAIIREINSE